MAAGQADLFQILGRIDPRIHQHGHRENEGRCRIDVAKGDALAPHVGGGGDGGVLVCE